MLEAAFCKEIHPQKSHDSGHEHRGALNRDTFLFAWWTVFEKLPSRSSEPEKKPLPARRNRGVDFGGVLETRIRHAPRILGNA